MHDDQDIEFSPYRLPFNTPPYGHECVKTCKGGHYCDSEYEEQQAILDMVLDDKLSLISEIDRQVAIIRGLLLSNDYLRSLIDETDPDEEDPGVS